MQNSPQIKATSIPASDNRNENFDFENFKDPFGTSSKIASSPPKMSM